MNNPKSNSKTAIKRRHAGKALPAFAILAQKAMIKAQKVAERENARFGLKLIVQPKRVIKRKLTAAR